MAAYSAKITSVEQIVSGLAARVATSDTSAASASSGSGSARSWNLLGQSDGSTATGSLGSPVTTTETQDADLILSQALRMNMHEVPSYYSFHVNSITLECLFRLIKSGKRQTYQLSTGPSEFIAKQVPYPPNSYSKQEPNVNTLRPGTRMMVSLTQLKAHFANYSTNITVRQSKRNWKTTCASLESFGPKATRIHSRT